MIDLRRPLEGVPGLLLMAALIFFGATIGIAIALGFTWIPMSDALANFLGGVVGAGLGAALAVMGAVYVQRRDLAARLRQPTNSLRSALEALDRRLVVLHSLMAKSLSVAELEGLPHRVALGSAVNNIEASVKSLPDGAELEPDTHSATVRLKLRLNSLVATIRLEKATPADVEQVLGHLRALRGALVPA